MKNDALTFVLSRNVFYRDGYRWAVVGFIYTVDHQLWISRDYCFIKLKIRRSRNILRLPPDGRMIKNYRLDDPVFPDDHVLQWTADAVRQTFSLDFMHWTDQLQMASNKFSTDGWREFLKALKRVITWKR